MSCLLGKLDTSVPSGLALICFNRLDGLSQGGGRRPATLQTSSKLFDLGEVEQGVPARRAGDDADEPSIDPFLDRGVRDPQNLTDQSAADLNALLCCHAGLNSTNRDACTIGKASGDR